MDIVYVGASGTDHLIHFLADGDRPILEIYVDEKDVVDEQDGQQMLRIRINGIGRPLDDIQPTRGTTHTLAKIDENGVETRICVTCLARYIVPRIATMLARVYVPKDVTANQG